MESRRATRQAVDLLRETGIVLGGMMLVSRALFQAAGARRMRAFLDAWKLSRTKQVWGAAACGWGCLLVARAAPSLRHWRGIERGLLAILAAVLIGDGLLNTLPGGFGRFKESLQAAWVRRKPDPRHQSDAALFGAVNLALAAASLAWLALVIGYRPIEPRRAVRGLGLATLLTLLLIGALLLEGGRQRSGTR
jgi:hypothetical protein